MTRQYCPICKAEARFAFSTQYAEVFRCSSRQCRHFFAAKPAEESGIVDYGPGACRQEFIQRNHRLIDYLVAHGVVPPGGRVLDLGSGEGHIAGCFKDRGFDIVCVEPSVSARNVLRARGLAHYESASDIPQTDLFDFVYMVEVIEHIPRPVETLTLTRRLLKPDGSILITTPCATGLKARAMRDKSESFGIPHHIHFFTPRSLRKCLNTAGFERIEQRYLSLLVPSRSSWRTMAAGLLHVLKLGSGITMIASPSGR